MKLKDLFSYKKPVQSVQTARSESHIFSGMMDYSPLMTPDCRLYAAMRESVPIIDAAIDKIVRLTGGFTVKAQNPDHQQMLDTFVRDVRVGACSRGLYPFVCTYLDSLLTYGNAVGEIVLDAEGREIAALYNADLSGIRIRQGKTPLDVEICSGDPIDPKPVKHPHLVLFTPLTPPAGQLRGVSLLRSLPFVTGILLKIYNSVGVNFQRVANLRYAVTYKPGNSGIDKAYAKDIADSIADEWSSAMQSSGSGVIKDFIAVGDVDVKVIGSDNQMIETEIPVRQMLEQIVAKLGIPPFMLGLHWSSTERMSSQQADILTSELESYRKLLEGVISRICEMHLRLQGTDGAVSVVWDDINLQDGSESANTRYIEAQAALLELQAEGEINENLNNN